MKKYIKYIIAFWVFFFTIVISMAITRHVYTNGEHIKGAPKEIVIFLSSFLSNVQHYDVIDNPMFVADIPKLKNGFNYTKNFKGSKDYILVSAWDKEEAQNSVKLLRIKDGKVIHKWIVDIEKNNKKIIQNVKNNDFRVMNKKTSRMLHPFLQNDGALVFGGEGVNMIDKNANYVWSNTTICHHSIERNYEGDFWICSYKSTHENEKKYGLRDDAIQKISKKNGEILFEKSIFELLMENGYNRALFFTNPEISTHIENLDYSHLNEVQPVETDSKYWKKGDVFVSLRHPSLVFLYRPSTNKIIWSQQGPWMKQHDVVILNDHQIAIFGNNVIDAKYKDVKKRLIDGNNIQYIYDFSTNKTTTAFTEFFKKSKIGTFTEGRSQILKDGNILVEESNHGRLLFGNEKNEIWTFVDRVDKNHLSSLNWCRYITEDEFKKFTFIKK